MSLLAAADNAHAQDKQTVPEKSLYERLGGVFAIAAVVDHFSDAVVKNPYHARSLMGAHGTRLLQNVVQRVNRTTQSVPADCTMLD